MGRARRRTIVMTLAYPQGRLPATRPALPGRGVGGPCEAGGVCGRYANSRRPDDLVEEFEVHRVDVREMLQPDYNVAPTKSVPVVLDRFPDGDKEGEPERRLTLVRWGLVPSWAPDTSGAARMINARLESVADRPAFRTAFQRRRCLIPADGWYEWAPADGRIGRQPHFITPADGSLLAFAGLYEVRDGALSCAIVTTAASPALASLHDRMPVVLDRPAWAEWLDPATSDPRRLLEHECAARLEVRPVGPAVGNVENNGPQLIAPVDSRPLQTLF